MVDKVREAAGVLSKSGEAGLAEFDKKPSKSGLYDLFSRAS